ncbi:MAG: cytochrome c3 family protein [Candidatus Tectomicrobia bacterium]|uniref:Cytochrome c3 family protein n=1 Tax=Tectimicrobiota bacterium TaxID=2528274 RepID=A0A933GNB1_UNCTE|nr:cytochrome c3 family protein [Candidatus Tectomicrobia bacterium]
MKKLLVVMFALVIGISFTNMAWSAAPPKEVKLEAKMGTVTFKHEEHAVTRKVECKTCHHMGTEGDKVKCSACHQAEAKDKTVAIKDAFHNVCKKCHEEKVKAGAKAPTKCNECHVKAS